MPIAIKRSGSSRGLFPNPQPVRAETARNPSSSWILPAPHRSGLEGTLPKQTVKAEPMSDHNALFGLLTNPAVFPREVRNLDAMFRAFELRVCEFVRTFLLSSALSRLYFPSGLNSSKPRPQPCRSWTVHRSSNAQPLDSYAVSTTCFFSRIPP